jgi:hypothetical protein
VAFEHMAGSSKQIGGVHKKVCDGRRQSKLARFKPEIARACHIITGCSYHMIVFQHPKICLRALCFCIALAALTSVTSSSSV